MAVYLLRVTEHRDDPLCSFWQTLTLINTTLIKATVDPCCSLTQAEKGGKGNTLKGRKIVVFMVQGVGERQSYCTVAKDVSASAIQTISRQHSGSSLQQPLSWRRRYSGGGSGSQFSELSPSCTNSLSVRDAWA